jgi:hypothetical protein
MNPNRNSRMTQNHPTTTSYIQTRDEIKNTLDAFCEPVNSEPVVEGKLQQTIKKPKLLLEKNGHQAIRDCYDVHYTQKKTPVEIENKQVVTTTTRKKKKKRHNKKQKVSFSDANSNSSEEKQNAEEEKSDDDDDDDVIIKETKTTTTTVRYTSVSNVITMVHHVRIPQQQYANEPNARRFYMTRDVMSTPPTLPDFTQLASISSQVVKNKKRKQSSS